MDRDFTIIKNKLYFSANKREYYKTYFEILSWSCFRKKFVIVVKAREFCQIQNKY